MSLIVIMGPQAVGKMTVGQALAEKIEGKLLYNHQTLDLYANFLGYHQMAFDLSDWTRKKLFQGFVDNRGKNETKHLIFTVLIAFDLADDLQFLDDISQIFLKAGEKVYFIELIAELQTRLARNVHEDRLKAKPSKQDLEFSRKELLEANKTHHLNSAAGEIEKQFPQIKYLRINNTNLSPEAAAELIREYLNPPES